MLKRHSAAAILALGLLFVVGPARVDPAVAATRPADSLVQAIQYHGRLGHYERHRFYGRPRYYERPQFHRTGRGYYGRRGYYR